MKSHTIFKLLITIFLPLLFSACVIGVGNRLPPEVPAATVGQELIDLQRALDAGAISPHEFEQQKTRIIGPTESRR